MPVTLMVVCSRCSSTLSEDVVSYTGGSLGLYHMHMAVLVADGQLV